MSDTSAIARSGPADDKAPGDDARGLKMLRWESVTGRRGYLIGSSRPS